MYREKLFGAVWQAPKQAKARQFIFNLIIAFLPAAVLGVLFHSQIKAVLFNPLVVASMLVIGGILIIVIEKLRPLPRVMEVDDIRWKMALKIGFCQALAMIPAE